MYRFDGHRIFVFNLLQKKTKNPQQESNEKDNFLSLRLMASLTTWKNVSHIERV